LESLLLVQREIEMKQLVMPFGLDSLRIRGHNIAYLASMAELPKIKAFQNWLFSELAHTEQWKQRVIQDTVGS
jgi:LysR family glycine cleavage system transcriptional activator